MSFREMTMPPSPTTNIHRVSFRRKDSGSGIELDPNLSSRNSFDSVPQSDGSSVQGSAWFGSQSSLFSFLNALRTKTYGLVYLSYFGILFLSSIPLTIPPDLPWGSPFRQIFSAIHVISTFGLQYSNPLTIKIIIAIFFSVYMVVFGVILISWRLFLLGSSMFNRTRSVINISLLILSTFAIQLTYAYSAFLVCDGSGSSIQPKFKEQSCVASQNVVWIVLGSICIICQFIVSALWSYIGTVVNPRESFVSLDTFTFNMYIQSCSIIFSVLRVVTSHVVWVRSLVMILQSLFTMCFLVAMVPYFHKRANSIEMGVTVGRFLMNVASLVLSIIGMHKENRIAGITIGSIALACPFIGIVIGLVFMELYMWIICHRAKTYADIIHNSQIIEFIVDIYARLSMSSTIEEVNQAEKLCKLCTTHGYESSYHYYNQALIRAYIRKDSVQYSTKLLKKALNCRPNYYRHFYILCRYNDFEVEAGLDSDSNKIFKMIASGKKKQKEYYGKVYEFWQEIMEKKFDFTNLYQITEQLESCSTDLDRIYTNMYDQWRNRPDVVRSYADYMDNIKWNKFLAQTLRDEAEDLENQSNRLQRIKQSFISRSPNNAVLPVYDDVPAKVSDSGPPQHESMAPSQHKHMNTKIDDENVDDLQSANELAQNMTAQENLREMILTMKPQWGSRIVLISFTFIIILLLIVILIMNVKGLGSGYTSALMNGCDMQILSYNILNTWRTNQIKSTLINDTSLNNTTVREIEFMKHESELLYSFLHQGVYTSFSSDRSRQDMLVAEKHPIRVPIVNGENLTYYGLDATVYDVVLSYGDIVHRVQPDNIHRLFDSYDFLFFWLNRRTLSDTLSTYCQQFYNEYIFNQAALKKVFAGIIAIIGSVNIVYLGLVFFPVFIYFLRERRRVLSLFAVVPKDVVGGVIQQLKDTLHTDEYHSKKRRSLFPPRYKLYLLVLLTFVIEGVCIFLCIYDSALKIFKNTATTDLVLSAGVMGKIVNQLIFATREIVFQEYYPKLNYTYTVDELLSETNHVKAEWDSLRFGVGTKGKKGFMGLDSYIDQVITDDVCTPHELIDLDPHKFYCKNLNYLTEVALTRMIALYLGFHQQTSLENLNEYREIQAVKLALMHKLKLVSDRFAIKSDETAGLSFPIQYLFMIAFAFLLLEIVFVNSAVNSERRINHEIRKLLYFIPGDILYSTPELTDFVVNFTFKSEKRKLEDSEKAKAILEGSTDGVIICTDSGVVLEMNSATKNMFQISDVDIIGGHVTQLFPDSNVLDLIREVSKTGKGLTQEYTANNKKTGPFPSKVSMSTGVLGDRQVVALFVRDCTIEVKQNQLINQEKKNSENLLLNILPASVAFRLKRGDSNISENIQDATCFFSDMVGFTSMSGTMTASELVELLNEIVHSFDDLCARHELEKIKTIGDAYFAVGGLYGPPNHTERVIRFGLDAIDSLAKFDGKIQIRCGCHTGPIVAGVIGKSKFAFDVWGNTVNIASRMESTGVPGKVQCSRAVYERCHDIFEFEERTGVQVKGVGEMAAYLVISVREGHKRPSYVSEVEGEVARARFQPYEQQDQIAESAQTSQTAPKNHEARRPSLTQDALKLHDSEYFPATD